MKRLCFLALSTLLAASAQVAAQVADERPALSHNLASQFRDGWSALGAVRP